MISASSVTKRAFAASIRQSGLPQRVRVQRYSTAKGASSSQIPWILSAVGITAGGVFYSVGGLSTTPATSHANSHSPDHTKASSKDHKTSSPEKEPTKQESQKAKDKDAIKPQHGGESVLKHGIAAEANEHKTRKGKFSGKEFDNHVQNHSRNPGEDFEAIQKKGAEEKEKKEEKEKGNEKKKSGKSE